jgi:ribosomal protein L21
MNIKYQNIPFEYILNENFWEEILVGRTIKKVNFKKSAVNNKHYIDSLDLDNGETIYLDGTLMIKYHNEENVDINNKQAEISDGIIEFFNNKKQRMYWYDDIQEYHEKDLFEYSDEELNDLIDNHIDNWHESNSNLSVYEWLGLTETEYKEFVESPSSLRKILESKFK